MELSRAARTNDNILVRFVQWGYDTGQTLSLCSCAIISVQYKFSQQGRLPRAWAAIRKWKLNMRSQSRAPIPHKLVLLVLAQVEVPDLHDVLAVILVHEQLREEG